MGTAIALVMACSSPAEPAERPVSTTASIGRALHKSDTSDLPDVPIRKGFVLFVPHDRLAQISASAGAAPFDERDMSHAAFRIDALDFGEIAGVAAPIDASGHFRVPVSPGRYWVCLSNVLAGLTPAPPYSVVGCAALVVPERAVRATVSFGEGGVEASVEAL